MKTKALQSITVPESLIHAVLAQDKVDETPHNLYKYPARFAPLFAREVIKSFSSEGDLVLDPFCGGGTTLLEAIAAGKYNAGGTGALRFCGHQNYQLIVSRRAPGLVARKTDPTNTDWGFTLVRRLRPTETSSRKSSMYVYYAPGGRVPSFPASAIRVLASESAVNKPPAPYTQPLKYGSCLKLYSYQWNASGIATRDPRYQLNKYLHNLVITGYAAERVRRLCASPNELRVRWARAEQRVSVEYPF